MNSQLKSSLVQLTLVAGCPHNCRYCPQDKFLQNYQSKFTINKVKPPKFMTFETFNKVLNNCYKKDKNGVIGFGGLSEPSFHPDCSKFIRYASDNGYRVSLSSSMAGFTPEDIDLIEDCDLTSVAIHLPDIENNAKINVDEKYKKILKKLHNSKIKIDCYSAHSAIHPEIKELIDTSLPVQQSFSDRAGLLDNKKLISVDKPLKGKLACKIGRPDGSRSGTISENFIILPNGYAVLCCTDFSLSSILGDFANTPFGELIYTEKFQKVFSAFDDDTQISICRRCTDACNRTSKQNKEFIPNMLSFNTLKIETFLNNRYKSATIPYRAELLKEKINKSSIKVVYGLGKLFRDNFFDSHWNAVINPDYLCDGNPDLWGTKINGIPVISPEELGAIRENLLVITWVTNDSAIRDKLRNLGIDNIINAYEIFNMFD